MQKDKVSSHPFPAFAPFPQASPQVQYKQLSGETREWIREKADSGNPVHYTVCKTCSTIVRVDAEAMPEMVIVKPGTLDDVKALGKLPVVQEIYTRNRPDCFAALAGAKQVEGAS